MHARSGILAEPRGYPPCERSRGSRGVLTGLSPRERPAPVPPYSVPPNPTSTDTYHLPSVGTLLVAVLATRFFCKLPGSTKHAGRKCADVPNDFAAQGDMRRWALMEAAVLALLALSPTAVAFTGDQVDLKQELAHFESQSVAVLVPGRARHFSGDGGSPALPRGRQLLQAGKGCAEVTSMTLLLRWVTQSQFAG